MVHERNRVPLQHQVPVTFNHLPGFYPDPNELHMQSRGDASDNVPQTPEKAASNRQPRSGTYHLYQDEPVSPLSPVSPIPNTTANYDDNQDGASMSLTDAEMDWIAANNEIICCQCQSRFNLVLRRHHCRSCGEAFCSHCSSRRLPLPYMGFVNPARVCDICFREADFHTYLAMYGSDVQQLLTQGVDAFHTCVKRCYSHCFDDADSNKQMTFQFMQEDVNLGKQSFLNMIFLLAECWENKAVVDQVIHQMYKHVFAKSCEQSDQQIEKYALEELEFFW